MNQACESQDFSNNNCNYTDQTVQIPENQLFEDDVLNRPSLTRSGLM